MEKVKILLSGKSKLQYYVDAVEAAGGIATAQYLPEISTEYDGLILCGGPDTDPSYYGQERNGADDIDFDRDAVDYALLNAYIGVKKPIFGICRGFQWLNIFFGGTLVQHIPEVDLHKSKGKDLVHMVKARENSILSDFYGTGFTVNSSHHQVLDRLGTGLLPTAYWDDRYVEAVEHAFLPVFGVQWHPERMCAGQKRNDTVDGIKLFEHFIALCKKHKTDM